MKNKNFLIDEGEAHYWFGIETTFTIFGDGQSEISSEFHYFIDDALTKHYGESCTISVEEMDMMVEDNLCWLHLINHDSDNNYDLRTLRKIINDAMEAKFASMDEADIQPIGTEVIVTAPSHIRADSAYLNEMLVYIDKSFDKKKNFHVHIDEDGEHIRITSTDCEDVDAIRNAFDAFNAEKIEDVEVSTEVTAPTENEIEILNSHVWWKIIVNDESLLDDIAPNIDRALESRGIDDWYVDDLVGEYSQPNLYYLHLANNINPTAKYTQEIENAVREVLNIPIIPIPEPPHHEPTSTINKEAVQAQLRLLEEEMDAMRKRMDAIKSLLV